MDTLNLDSHPGRNRIYTLAIEDVIEHCFVLI